MTTTIILTDYGNDRILQAIADESTVTVSAIVYGDGNGAEYTPLPSQTNLVHQIGSIPLLEKTFDQIDGFIYFKGTIDASSDDFTIRELGLVDDTNSLLAVGVIPATAKPSISEGIEVSLPLAIGFRTSAGSVLVVEHDISEIASKAWTLDNFQLLSEKGQSNGYAPLDVNGVVPANNSLIKYEVIGDSTYDGSPAKDVVLKKEDNTYILSKPNVATNEIVGGIIVGEGLEVQTDGTLSVTGGVNKALSNLNDEGNAKFQHSAYSINNGTTNSKGHNATLHAPAGSQTTIKEQFILENPLTNATNGEMGGDKFGVVANYTWYGNYAWQVFNKNFSTGWYATRPSTSVDWTLDIYNPEPLNITNIKIFNSATVSTYGIKAGYISVSNDYETWTEIKTFTNTVFTAGNSWNISLTDNTQSYKYYRIGISEPSNRDVAIAEIELTAFRILQVSSTSNIICDPCTITTVDSKTKTFEYESTLDCSDFDDGTYKVFKNFITGELVAGSTQSSYEVPYEQPVLNGSNGIVGGNEFACFASGEWSSNNEAWRAFDGVKNDVNNAWIARTYVPAYLGCYTPVPITLHGIYITNTYEPPGSIIVQYSYDGTTWLDAKSYTNENNNRLDTWYVKLDTPISNIQYVRMYIETSASAESIPRVAEMTLDATISYSNASSLEFSVSNDGETPVKLYPIKLNGATSLSNKGILSNFTASNYAIIPSLFDPEANDWSLNLYFETGNDASTTQTIYYGNNCISITIDTGNLLVSLGDGTSFNILNLENAGTVSTNTIYNIKINYDGSDYTILLNDTLAHTETSATTVGSHSPMLGLNSNNLYPFLGKISLNNSYLSVEDDSIVWAGIPENKYVYMGNVTINSSNIESITNTAFNKLRGYLIDSYQNGSSWYRIYSDNWCEQGGTITSGTSGSITYALPYKTLDGVVTGNCTVSATTTGLTWTKSAGDTGYWQAYGCLN